MAGETSHGNHRWKAGWAIMKDVPLVDLSIPHKRLGPAILAAIEQLMADSDFIGGKRLKNFEAQFAAFTGARFAVGVSNGTSAIALALKANGVGPGDEVITVAHTFVATAEAILDAGGVPVFVDVDPVSGVMTAENVAAQVTGKTRAVLPVHLYGHPVDLSAISKLCSERGLKLIQDSSQAHGALWDGMPLSAFGEAQTYSFYPGKNLGAWGDAGAVVTNDESMAEQLRSLRDHGRRSGAKYLHEDIGGNYRMDPIQAIVLSHKLPDLGLGNARRRELFRYYSDCLTGIGDISIIAPTERGTAVHHLFVIRSKAREELKSFLRENGIATGIHYPVPLHRQPAFARFAAMSLPNTEQLSSEVLSLPFYPELGQEQAQRVSDTVRRFFQKRP
jgi:dTDP-4-amino-4,6-dideoxygalactose transaminase